jgi:hypothetical protein
MVSPSICGGLLSDKRSMVAFTWTITTVLTLLAFLAAMVVVIQIHAHYRRTQNYYDGDDWYQQYLYQNQYNNNDDGEEEHGQSQDRNQYMEIREQYEMLRQLNSKSIAFVPIWTVILALGLTMYGSTAIVGFTSLRGDYIAPCFSNHGPNKMAVGIFGGAIVIFANLLLVCAVILGEVRVSTYIQHNNMMASICLIMLGGSTSIFCSNTYLTYIFKTQPEMQVEDYKDGREREDMEPYQVERISAVLAVLCMFLSAVYTIFAVLLFLSHANDAFEDDFDHDGADPRVVKTQQLVPVSGGSDHHQPPDFDLNSPGFITMEDSSSR